MIDFLWNTFIYQPMVNSLLYIYNGLGHVPLIGLNYGLAIILFTLIIKLITLPISVKQTQSMRTQQEKQARVKPKLDEIKKKFKDSPEKLQQAQMELYRKEGMLNPFNAGCLLSLLPWPIFVGLYNVITQVMGDKPEQLLELSRHLYSFLPQLATVVPVNPYFFGLNLAISPQSQGIITTVIIVGLVAGSTWLQSKMMTQPTASLDPQAAQMNQSMQLMMPMMIGFFALSLPTGLSLYWMVFNIVGIIQQYVMLRPKTGTKMVAQPPSSTTTTPTTTPTTVTTTGGTAKGKKNGRKKSGMSRQNG